MNLKKIDIPQSNTASFVEMDAGSKLVLSFAANQAVFERAGNDLAIRFEGAATVTVQDFFVAGDNPLPVIVLEDGTEIEGATFLAALDPNMDVSTAAGPAASTSSGAGSYDDGASSLLDGVDRMGSLGSTQWATGTPLTADPVVEKAFIADADSGTPGGGTPGGIPGTQPPVAPGAVYHARLFISEGDNATQYSFFAQDAQGSCITDPSKIQIQFAQGTSQYFSAPVIDPLTGEITIALTQAGLDALASGTPFNDALRVSVDGVAYDMLLVGNKDANYSSADHETALGGGLGQLVGEWYASDGASLTDTHIVLGNAMHNQVDISHTTNNSSPTAAQNIGIDVSAGSGTQIVNISASAPNHAARAVAASSGTASIKTDSTGTIDISSNAVNAYGVHVSSATADAKAEIMGGDISVSAEANGGSSRALYSFSNQGHKSEVNIHGENVSVTGSASGGTVGSSGIFSRGTGVGSSSSVTVRADDTLTIALTSSNNPASGVSTTVGSYDSSHISLSGHNVDISAHGKAAIPGNTTNLVDTYGIQSSGKGAITDITADAGGTMKINIAQDHAKTTVTSSINNLAVGAYQGGKTTLTASDMDIQSTIDQSTLERGFATGIYSGYRDNAGNRATVNLNGYAGEENKIQISATGAHAIGSMATNYGQVFITGGSKNDEIVVNSTGGGAGSGTASVGVFSQAETAKTVIDGGIGDDSLTITSIYAGQGTGSLPMADGIATGAVGLLSLWGGANIEVKGVENIDIVADSSAQGGSSYGMLAYGTGGGHVNNLISNTDSAITVTITATSNVGNALAMYAQGVATNTIIGGSKIGDAIGDHIILNGDVSSRTWGGLGNKIVTGDGDDVITINGSLSAGAGQNLIETGMGNDTLTIRDGVNAGTGVNNVNIINTGDGNDVIRISGPVGNGALNLDAGAGDDTLVLTADNFAAFQSYFGDWLSDHFATMGVESIHVSFGNAQPQDMVDLQVFFDNALFGSAAITYDTGTTLFLDGQENITLDGLLGVLDIGNEINTIDLVGDSANVLTIDNLSSLTTNHLTVLGDSSDTLNLEGDWTNTGSNAGMTTYSNGVDTIAANEQMTVLLMSNSGI